MILDERNEFCDATTLSTATGLELVGNVMDLEQVKDLGNGQPLYLVIQITTAVEGTSSTVQFQFVSDAQAALAADGSETLHVQSDAIAEADLVAGYQIVLPVPPEANKPYERYVGIQRNVGTAVLTAGAINAFLTLDPPGLPIKHYPDAI